MPQGLVLQLERRPRLESWNRHDHPDQLALREFVGHVHDLIDPLASALEGPLAFHLHVAIPPQFDPWWERDLDNYLFPIARTLPERVVTVWGTKGRGEVSTIRLEPAVSAALPSPVFHVPRASTAEGNWKAAVRVAVEASQELPEGPVGVQLAFTVGRGVSWPTLWKPSIDALSPLLGRTYPDREWNPLDGRIVRLGLHKTVDPAYGRAASVKVHAARAEDNWPELHWLATMTSEQRRAFFDQHRDKVRARAARSRFMRPAGTRRRAQTQTARKLDPGSANVLVFQDDDDAYLGWIAAHRTGFVLNIQRSLNPSTARIHHADCWTISGEPTHGKVWTGPYIKICAADLHELDAWAAERAGSPISRCGTCSPTAA